MQQNYFAKERGVEQQNTVFYRTSSTHGRCNERSIHYHLATSPASVSSSGAGIYIMAGALSALINTIDVTGRFITGTVSDGPNGAAVAEIRA